MTSHFDERAGGSTSDFEVVITAFNEAKSLAPLIQRYRQCAQDAQLSNKQFQLIVVNNGSSDDSESILNNLKNTDLGGWFRVVKVDKNIGYGNGLFVGLSTTTAPLVGYSHADEQCSPDDVFKARSVWMSENNSSVLVKGVRSGRNIRDIFVSRVFESLAFLFLGLKVYEINAQPKVFSRDLLPKLKRPPLHFEFDLYVLYHAKKNNISIHTISVNFPPRVHGVSRWAATFISKYKTILLQIKYMLTLLIQEGRV